MSNFQCWILYTYFTISNVNFVHTATFLMIHFFNSVQFLLISILQTFYIGHYFSYMVLAPSRLCFVSCEFLKLKQRKLCRLVLLFGFILEIQPQMWSL